MDMLSTTNTLSGGDKLVVYVANEGSPRAASLTSLLAYFNASFVAPGFSEVIAAPTFSGFNVPLAASPQSVWLVLNPTGDFAAGSITLPAVASAYDGQEILVTSSQSITALTINGNGASVQGAPAALGDGGFFALRFGKSTLTWYCISQSLGATGSTFTTLRDVNGNIVFSMQPNYTPPGTDVVYVEVTNRSAGSPPKLSVNGPATNIAMAISAKGSGALSFGNGSGSSDFAFTSVTWNAVADFNINAGTTFTVVAQLVTIAAPTEVTSLRTPPVTVAALPAASTGRRGTRLYVIDSSVAATGNFGAVVTGGGANSVPVQCDGAAWRIG